MIRDSEKSSLNILGDKVAKLQKLRKQSTATFFGYRDDELQTSEGRKPAILDNEHIHSKLKSAVMLLSESLEEQGRLRALLEYTADPKSGSRFSLDNCENEVKYRGAILNQEKLLAEVRQDIGLLKY